MTAGLTMCVAFMALSTICALDADRAFLLWSEADEPTLWTPLKVSRVGTVPTRGLYRYPSIDTSEASFAVRWVGSETSSMTMARHVSLRICNTSDEPLSGRVGWMGREGLLVEPARIDVNELDAGGVLTVKVGIDASQVPSNRVFRLFPVLIDPAVGLTIERMPLRICNGIAKDRSVGVNGSAYETIYSPRYTVRYRYTESGAAQFLLDPSGRRWSRLQEGVLPVVRRDRDGGESHMWKVHQVGRHRGFRAVRVPGPNGGAAHFYDSGHDDGGMSLSHTFTEDWIACRLRAGRGTQRLSMDWFPELGSTSTDLRAFAGLDGKVHFVKESGVVVGAKIRMVYRRSPDREYGAVCLYPVGAVLESKGVTFPADKACGVSFCKDDGVRGLTEKWMTHRPVGAKMRSQLDLRVSDAEKVSDSVDALLH